MRLLVILAVLSLALSGIIGVLATLSFIGQNSKHEIIMQDGPKMFTKENCVEDDEGITCVENSYLQETIESKPKFTGFTIREKVFVPQYVVKEQIVYEEKKLLGDERQSPKDRIKDDDVSVFYNSVRIDIKNANWRKYVDSNSMDPLIDIGTTTIEIKPRNPDEIKVGDIIAFDVEGFDYAFVHRVVDTGTDAEGVYFVTKGDNYYKEDPDKVRFTDVEGIVVGILY